jgi:hypothetical protein
MTAHHDWAACTDDLSDAEKLKSPVVIGGIALIVGPFIIGAIALAAGRCVVRSAGRESVLPASRPIDARCMVLRGVI